MNDFIFRINNNTFHKEGDKHCFNYVNAWFSDFNENIIRKNVNISIIVHLPTRNIVDYVINKKQFETFITLKDIQIKDISYERGLYVNSSSFLEYQTNPNNRELEKEIKENLIKNPLEQYSKKVFDKYVNKLMPFMDKYDYNKLLKNEYLYYYLAKYLKLNVNSKEIENFYDFIKKEEKNNIKINTIEEYIEKNSEYEEYSFIRVTDNFILIPNYKYLITPNDLLYLFKQKQSNFVNYLNLKLMIIYRYKFNINSVIDAGNQIEEGKITINEWNSLLDEVNEGTHNYFKNIFKINQHLRKDIEKIPGIIMKKDNIYIWTNIHPTVKFFYFNAEFVDDGFDKTDLKWEFYSRINLSDIYEYSRLGMLSKFIFNFLSKQRDTEIFNCFNDCKTWDNAIQNLNKNIPDVSQEMLDKYMLNDTEYQFGGLIEQNNKDKITQGEMLVNINRNDIIEIIKEIEWSGSIIINDCNIKIYGKHETTKENYVLYIIPKILKNEEINNYLNSRNIRKIFSLFFIGEINYTLYLHLINKDNVTNESEIVNENTLKQIPDKQRQYTVKILINDDYRKLLNKLTVNKFKKDIEQINEKYISHIIFEGKALLSYKKSDLNSFPEELVNKTELENNIFKFTRLLLVTNTLNNDSLIINSVEFTTIKNNTAKNPYPNINYQYYCPIAFFISTDNKIKYENKINTENINTTHKMNELIKDFFVKIYSIKDYFIIVGYPLPWRDGKIINIFSLVDEDYEYLKNLMKLSKKCIVDYINKLNITVDNKKITITTKNIDIFAHYPNGNGDIHFHFYIYKKQLTNYSNRKIIIDYDRIWNINEILNLLKLRINFFQNIVYMTTQNLTHNNFYNKLLQTYKDETSKNKKDKIQRFIPVTHNNIFKQEIQIGGNSSKFVNWVNKYLTYENIFKIYSLPIIWIEYEIKETNKEPLDRKINEYYKCFDIKKYNTVHRIL